MLILGGDEGVIGRRGAEGTAPHQGIDLRRRYIQRRPAGQGQKKDLSVLGLKTVHLFPKALSNLLFLPNREANTPNYKTSNKN